MRHKLPAQLHPPLHGRAGPPKRGSGVPGEEGAAASGDLRNSPSLPSTISSSLSGALGSQSAVTAFPGGGKGGRQGGGVKGPTRGPKRPLGTSPAEPQQSTKETRITSEKNTRLKSEVIVVISRNAVPLALPVPLGPPISYTPGPKHIYIPASRRDGDL